MKCIILVCHVELREALLLLDIVHAFDRIRQPEIGSVDDSTLVSMLYMKMEAMTVPDPTDMV